MTHGHESHEQHSKEHPRSRARGGANGHGGLHHGRKLPVMLLTTPGRDRSNESSLGGEEVT